uniref:NADH-ubiquinone oxidoreductase chain 4L n=1 Tax=Sceleocantha sp. 4 MJ-2019 TaxID=2607376 RepID=A0A6H0N2C2_9CUCU|nr:NADH dehydrogenase subunit 4L [Sceleocantha sp. 4 MJ-2019]
MMMYFTSIFMFFSGLAVFSSKRKHLLLMLLSLEFIVLSLYLNIFVYLSMNGYDYFFTMVFITMSVCEGVLGLSILVSMIRTYGNDYILTFSFLW